jgi:hypothetical protein
LGERYEDKYENAYMLNRSGDIRHDYSHSLYCSSMLSKLAENFVVTS